MYLEYYGFEREPFHITPDPEFLFLSPSHKEAFATVVYGVEQRKGFVALTGEVGTGKTTILRAYLKRIERGPIRPIYLFNPDMTFDELLRVLLRDMGEEPKGESSQSMLDRLQWLLVNEYKEGRNVVLIIDEAQNMPVETLEKLRMLSNLETAKDKLIQIVLVGQPELQDKLDLHELRQLRQRIAVRAIIRSLTPKQSHEYIRYRLTQAGCLRESVFSNAALRSIVRRAKGNPRVLNILCDNALIAGFGALEESVSSGTVREVARDVLGGRKANRYLKWAAAAMIALLIGGVSVVLAYGGSANPASARPQDAIQTAVALNTPESVPVVDTTPAEARPTVESTPTTPPAGDLSFGKLPESSEPASAPVSIETPAAASAPAVKSADHKEIALRKMNELLARAEPVAPIQVAAQEPAPSTDIPEAVAPPPQELSLPENTPPSSPVDGNGERMVASALEPAAASRETGAATLPELEQPASDGAVVDHPPIPGQHTHTAMVLPAPAAPESAEKDTLPSPDTPISVTATEAPTKSGLAAPAEAAPEPVAQVLVQEAVTSAGTETAAGDETIRLISRYVQRGDCLTRLVAEVYGRSTPSLLESVRRHNPHVLNADIIWYGDTLVFPERIVDEKGAMYVAAIPGNAPPGE